MLETYDEKVRFIKDLCDNCKYELLDRVRHMPDNWDGHELRRYIADHFAEQVFEMSRTRLKEYKNDVMTREGL